MAKMAGPNKTIKVRGQRCSICTHPSVKKINSLIQAGKSLHSIALNFNSTAPTVTRHTQKCLSLAISAVLERQIQGQGIDVVSEFTEQLAFAKRLRVAAEEYLSYAADPLKISLMPRADEIDVTYFDQSELNERGKPTKKTDSLASLLYEIEAGGRYESDKISIKHVDIRKFALDAINVTDACIDKFAKLAGLYTQEKKNPEDVVAAAKIIADNLIRDYNWTPELAMEAARAELERGESVH